MKIIFGNSNDQAYSDYEQSRIDDKKFDTNGAETHLGKDYETKIDCIVGDKCLQNEKDELLQTMDKNKPILTDEQRKDLRKLFNDLEKEENTVGNAIEF